MTVGARRPGYLLGDRAAGGSRIRRGREGSNPMADGSSDDDPTNEPTDDEPTGEKPTAAGDTSGTVLRTLLAKGIGEPLADLADPVDVLERGDDPEPTDRLPELIAGGNPVVGVVPRIGPSLARQAVGDGVGDGSGDTEIRLVFTGSAGERLTSPSGAAIRPILTNRGIDAYVHDGDSPLGVLLVGERVIVGLFDDGGLAALLWSEAPVIREWAAATCGRYLNAADHA